MKNKEYTFRPALFSTPMVQGILEDRKTLTRRLVDKNEDIINKNDIVASLLNKSFVHFTKEKQHTSFAGYPSKYRVGDIIWVRETFANTNSEEYLHTTTKLPFLYKADLQKDVDAKSIMKEMGWKWKPSIYMPKEACRIFLEVTNVRVERLQDISESDAIMEGVEFYFNKKFQENRFKDYQKAKPGWFKPQRFYKSERAILGYGEWRDATSSFISLWESINGKKSWNKNPWVWVYEFKRVERPLGFC